MKLLDAARPRGALFQTGSSPGWPWRSLPALALALAAASVLAMLMAFHAVMRGAVEQAQARQQVLAADAEAKGRCKALRGLRASGACLSLLKVAAAPQALNLETGLPVN